jgi:hypothetical protein
MLGGQLDAFLNLTPDKSMQDWHKDEKFRNEKNVEPSLSKLDTFNVPTINMEGVRLLDLRELDYIEKFLETLAPAPEYGRKQPMDEQEKRVRHVASEHKRRNRIKDELARMSRLVPNATKSKVRNSQAKILGQANDYIEELKMENEKLRTILLQIGCIKTCE